MFVISAKSWLVLQSDQQNNSGKDNVISCEINDAARCGFTK